MAAATTGTPDLQHNIFEDSIGGADLSVFFMSEIWIANNPELVIVDLDNVTSVSYSRIRERFPVRQLGKANPVAYTDGIVTTAGHIAFNIFANDALARLRGQLVKQKNTLQESSAQLKKTDTPASNFTGNIVDTKLNAVKAYESSQLNKVVNLDQLPPFHLLIMGVNEKGTISKLMIRNVVIADENQYHGTQQPNILNKVSWLATDVVPLYSSAFKDDILIESIGNMQEQYAKTGDFSFLNFYGYDLTGNDIYKEIERKLYPQGTIRNTQSLGGL